MRAAVNPPAKWQAYLASRQRPPVRSFQEGGAAEPEAPPSFSQMVDYSGRAQESQDADDEETTGATPPSFSQMTDYSRSDLPQLAKGSGGMLEAAGISAGREAAPAAGGLVAGLYGARLGAAAGLPLAEVTAGLSVPAGAIIGGLGGALGGGALLSKAQDAVLNALGLKETVERYGEAAEKQYPMSSFVGGLAPNLAGMAAGNVGTVARLGSAAIQAGLEGLSEYRDSGRIDPNTGQPVSAFSPAKLATAAVAGGIFARPRAGVESVVSRLPGAAQAEEAVQRAQSADTAVGRFTGDVPPRAPPTTGDPNVPTPQEAPAAERQPAAAEDDADQADEDARTPISPDNTQGTAPVAVKPAQAPATEMAGVRSADEYPKPQVPFGRRKTPPATIGDLAPDVSAALQAAPVERPALWDQQHPVSETPSVPGGPTTGDIKPEIGEAVRAKLDPEGYAQQRGQQVWRDAGLLGQQTDRPAVWGGSAGPRTAATTSAAKPYWELPGRATEYGHGDEDMGHVTLNRGQEVPGNVASDPGDPGKIFVDKNLPAMVNVGGKPIDPAYPLGVRENTRRGISDMLAQVRAQQPKLRSKAQAAEIAQHEEMANAYGDDAERQWLQSRGYDYDQFKQAIGEGEPQAAPGAAPGPQAPEATGAVPAAAPVPPPSPVEAGALRALSARQSGIPPGEPQALAALAARQQAPAAVTEAPRPGPAGAPPEQEPPPRPQPPPPPAPAPPPPAPAPPPPRPTFGKRQVPPRVAAPAPEATGTTQGPPPTPPAQAAATARDAVAVEQARQQGVMGTIKDFVNDERGTVNMPQALKMLTAQGGGLDDAAKLAKQAQQRFAPPKESFRTKRAGSPQEAFAQGISDRFFTLNQQRVNSLVGIQRDLADLKGTDKTMMADPSVQQQLYRAHEAGTVDQLAPRTKAFYDKNIKPMLDDSAQAFSKIQALTKDWDEAERAEFLGDLDPTHLHRTARGYNAPWDQLVSGQSADPVEGIVRGLRTNPSSLQARKFFAIEDANGKRTVVTPTDEGLTLWDNGNRTDGVKMEGEFKVGDTVEVNGKEYTVRQALTPEIKENARFANGQMADYHENMMLSAVEENVKLNDALRNLQYLDELKADPKFQQWTANMNDPEGLRRARANGWQPSQMPQMRNIAMDPYLQYAFDDYARPGLQSPVFDRLRSLSQGVTKTLFFTPIPHSLNAFWHWWVGRGWDWIKPTEWANLMPELMRAYRSVITQDALQTAIRDAGGATVEGGVWTSNFQRNIADGIGLDMRANPAKWVRYAETMGLGQGAAAADNLLRGLYRWSSNTMWSLNDILLTHQIIANQRNGMALEQAIGHAEQHIPNYRMPMTVLGSRTIAQVLGDPSIVAFGRYHYGVYNSLSRMVKGLTFGDNEQRTEAAGNLFALAMFAGVMKPLVLDPVVRAITGDQNSETRPRGPLAPLTSAQEIIEGKKDYSALTTQAATISPLVSWMLQTLQNRDFAGKHIITPGSSLPVQGGELADQALKTIAPYGTIATAWNRYPGSDLAGTALRSLAEQFADVKTPSPGAAKFEQGGFQKTNLTEEKQRAKKPQGPIEAAVRALQ